MAGGFTKYNKLEVTDLGIEGAGDRFPLFNSEGQLIGFILKANLEGFIPLSGTTEGNPITGDLYLDDAVSLKAVIGGGGFYLGDLENISLQIPQSDGTTHIEVRGEETSKGLVGFQFFNKQNDPNAYAQLGDITNLTSNGYVEKSATYMTVLADGTINCTSGTFTVTLTTTDIPIGKIFRVKNSGAGVITVAVESGALIDGIATKIFNVQYTGGVFQFDGSNYILIGDF